MTVSRTQHAFTLLAVDDNANNLYTLRQLIDRHMDVEVLEATSGQAAIETALAAPRIDLIVLDVQMPGMDGFETARLLKSLQRTRDIPVVFLTAAFKAEEFQRQGYAIGAADYLLKPIDDNQLINKLSGWFRLIDKERSLTRRLETEVRERTRELEESKRHTEAILTHMGEALLLLDPSGAITYANREALRLLGYREGELTGRKIGDVFEEEDPEQARAFLGTWLEAVIRAGVIRDVEACFVTSSGTRVPILFSRAALHDAEGRLTDIICIARDMTGFTRHG